MLLAVVSRLFSELFVTLVRVEKTLILHGEGRERALSSGRNSVETVLRSVIKHALAGIHPPTHLIVDHGGDFQNPIQQEFVVECDPIQLSPLFDHFTAVQ